MTPPNAHRHVAAMSAALERNDLDALIRAWIGLLEELRTWPRNPRISQAADDVAGDVTGGERR